MKAYNPLLLSLLIVFTTSYVYQRDFSLAELKQDYGWLYLDSFIFKPNQVKIDVRLAVIGKGESKTHKIFLQFIPSSKWQEQIEKKCRSGLNIPLIVQPLRMNGQVQQNTIHFNVQEVDTYHLVVKDCIQSFRKDYDNPNVRVFLKLSMRDANDSPFKEALVAPNQQSQIDKHRQQTLKSAQTQQQQSNEQISKTTEDNSTSTNEPNPSQSIDPEATSQL